MKASKEEAIRILIADDHTLFRSGLKKILDMEEDMQVCGEAKNGEEVIKEVNDFKPDVILMDINMPLVNGVEATRLVKEKIPDVNVIALTIHEDEEHLFEIVKEGASGFLLKDVDTLTLVQAIREVARGNSFIQPNITKKLLGGFNRIAKNSPVFNKDDGSKECELTNREREVLDLIARGYNNNKISLELIISEKTVKNHVSSILRKLEVSDRTQAAITALKRGIVQM